MEDKVHHILNGDALRYQFPQESISGEIMVMRECLIEGDVHGDSLSDFLETRASSLSSLYGFSKEEYIDKSVPEIESLNALKNGEVILWFEDDLFCQINLWFVCSLLERKLLQVALVRPKNSTLQYGFGGMSKNDLIEAFEERQSLSSDQVKGLAELWSAYKNADFSKLSVKGEQLNSSLPFLKDAIQAQLDRNPSDGGIGRPEKVILELIKKHGKHDFGKVFKDFSQNEPIYGFGDVQVKRLFNQLTR